MLLPASCTCVYTFHFEISIESQEIAKVLPSGFLDARPVPPMVASDITKVQDRFQESNTTARCAIHSVTCTDACGHHVSQHTELSPHQQISPVQLLCGHPLLPPTPSLTHGNHWSLLHLYNIVISRMLHQSYSTWPFAISFSRSTTPLRSCSFLLIPKVCSNVDVWQFVYVFTCWWTFGLFPMFGKYE